MAKLIYFIVLWLFLNEAYAGHSGTGKRKRLPTPSDDEQGTRADSNKLSQNYDGLLLLALAGDKLDENSERIKNTSGSQVASPSTVVSRHTDENKRADIDMILNRQNNPPSQQSGKVFSSKTFRSVDEATRRPASSSSEFVITQGFEDPRDSSVSSPHSIQKVRLANLNLSDVNSIKNSLMQAIDFKLLKYGHYDYQAIQRRSESLIVPKFQKLIDFNSNMMPLVQQLIRDFATMYTLFLRFQFRQNYVSVDFTTSDGVFQVTHNVTLSDQVPLMFVKGFVVQNKIVSFPFSAPLSLRHFWTSSFGSNMYTYLHRVAFSMAVEALLSVEESDRRRSLQSRRKTISRTVINTSNITSDVKAYLGRIISIGVEARCPRFAALILNSGHNLISREGRFLYALDAYTQLTPVKELPEKGNLRRVMLANAGVIDSGKWMSAVCKAEDDDFPCEIFGTLLSYRRKICAVAFFVSVLPGLSDSSKSRIIELELKHSFTEPVVSFRILRTLQNLGAYVSSLEAPDASFKHTLLSASQIKTVLSRLETMPPLPYSFRDYIASLVSYVLNNDTDESRLENLRAMKAFFGSIDKAAIANLKSTTLRTLIESNIKRFQLI